MITVIANLKGGVGKSTLSLHFIIWLLKKNKKVKAVDLDPQKTLTDIIEVRAEEKILPEVDLSNLSLMNADNDFSGYDEVIIDVGAQSMVDLKLAVIKSQRIILPVMPSQSDIWATQRFLKMVKTLRREDDMPEILAVVNRGDTNKNNYDTSDTHEALGMIGDIKVMDTIIYDSEDFRIAVYEGMSCTEFNPTGTAAQDFNNLAESIYSYLKGE